MFYPIRQGEVKSRPRAVGRPVLPVWRPQSPEERPVQSGGVSGYHASRSPRQCRTTARESR